MNETLRLLYDRFYIPLPMAESEQEVETCHRQLIERLDKPERKLVLRIIDAQNLMIEQRSVDSFICGFRLAWEMANELNHYMEERPEPEDDLGPGGNPKFCVTAKSGANRVKFIMGGRRVKRLPPCLQHNASGTGCQGGAIISPQPSI